MGEEQVEREIKGTQNGGYNSYIQELKDPTCYKKKMFCNSWREKLLNDLLAENMYDFLFENVTIPTSRGS